MEKKIYLSINTHTYTLAADAHSHPLCATLTVIGHPLPLNRHEGARLTHAQDTHTTQALSHVQKPTYLLSVSPQEDIPYARNRERARILI